MPATIDLLRHTSQYILTLSWQAALLITLTLLLRRLVGPRLSPNWRAALWLLVAIRLLSPGGVGGSRFLPSIPHAPKSPTASIPIPNYTVTFLPAPSLHAIPAISKPIQTNRPSLSTILTLIWLTGVLLLLTRHLYNHLTLRRLLHRLPLITDESILQLIRSVATEMSFRRPLRAVRTDHLRSPAVTGLFRPTLMLPATLPLNPADLRLILLHEFAHLRRHDLLAETISSLLVSLHWFNPFVHLASRAARADRELACDRSVLLHLGPTPASHQAYGDCLLRLLSHLSSPHPHPATLGIFGLKRNLRHRISFIASHLSIPSRPFANLAVFSILACAAATDLHSPSTYLEPLAVRTYSKKVSLGFPNPDNQIPNFFSDNAPPFKAPSIKTNNSFFPSEQSDAEPVTTVYDVRDLIVVIPDFYSPSSHIQPSPSTPEENTLAIENTLRGVIPTGLSIRHLIGQLIITGTPKHQSQVADLLERLRESRSIQVTIEARFFEFDPDQVPKELAGKLTPLLGPGRIQKGAAGEYFTYEQAQSIIRAVLALPNSTLLTAPRVTLFNGQHAYISVGQNSVYTSAYTAIRKDNGDTHFEPVLSTITAGLSCDFQATAGPDHRFITVTIAPTFRTLDGFKHEPFAADKNLLIDRPISSEQNVQATLSIPDGQYAALRSGPMSPTDKRTLFVLFRPILLIQTPSPPKPAHSPNPQ